MDQFICRHATPSVITPVQAGSQLEVQWDLTAAHPGDCSFYISYDHDKSPSEMEWFKVANLMDCKAVRMHQGAGTVDKWNFQLPSWLPGGRAVLRWEWAALHIPTAIEFFVQCADIDVTPTASEISITQIPTFKVFDEATQKPLTLPGSWLDMSLTPNIDSDIYGYSYRSEYNNGG